MSVSCLSECEFSILTNRCSTSTCAGRHYTFRQKFIDLKIYRYLFHFPLHSHSISPPPSHSRIGKPSHIPVLLLSVSSSAPRTADRFPLFLPSSDCLQPVSSVASRDGASARRRRRRRSKCGSARECSWLRQRRPDCRNRVPLCGASTVSCAY